MVNGKRPCSIGEQGAAFKSRSGANEPLKRFTARQPSFACDGRQMNAGLFAKREMTLAFAALVGADGHESNAEGRPHNSLPPHHGKLEKHKPCLWGKGAATTSWRCHNERCPQFLQRGVFDS